MHLPDMTRVSKGRVKNPKESVTFSALGAGDGGRRSHSLDEFCAAQNPFLCPMEAPKQTLYSLLTSDMPDIAGNSVLKPDVLSPVPQ